MLVDLVSPWAAAVLDSRGREADLRRFRSAHADLLDALRRQRTPHLNAFPLATSRGELRALAERAGAPDLQQRLRDAISQAADLDIDTPVTLHLLAGADEGEPMEAIPLPRASVVLLLDRCPDEPALIIALARGLVAITRWTARWSTSPVKVRKGDEWDRWRLAQEVPLGEWLYTEALGLHLARQLLPDVPLHELFGVTRGVLHRLREREHALRVMLEDDIDQAGIGLVLRWITAGAPASARRRGKVIIPARAGAYLGYRMLEARVERVGVGEAARMEA